MLIDDVRPLSEAAANHVSFIDTNKKYLAQLATTTAGACLVAPQLAERLPKTTAALITPQPYHGFARALLAVLPAVVASDGRQSAARPTSIRRRKLEDGVFIEPGAIVGAEAQIGRGTRIAAGAVVGARCRNWPR